MHTTIHIHEAGSAVVDSQRHASCGLLVIDFREVADQTLPGVTVFANRKNLERLRAEIDAALGENHE